VGDDAWAAALGGNLLAPMELIRAVLGGMRARRFGRIVNITSGLVKSPTPEMVLSVSARAALMTLAKAVQTDTLADNVTINNLLPGPFRTDRLKALAQTIAASDGISVEEAFARLGARACRAHRRSGGIWRLLRLSVLGAGGLYFGPEPADRRRGLSGVVLRKGASGGLRRYALNNPVTVRVVSDRLRNLPRRRPQRRFASGRSIRRTCARWTGTGMQGGNPLARRRHKTPAVTPVPQRPHIGRHRLHVGLIQRRAAQRGHSAIGLLGVATPAVMVLASPSTEPSLHRKAGPASEAPAELPLPSDPWQPAQVPPLACPM
jgi:hypothetical protein